MSDPERRSICTNCWIVGGGGGVGEDKAGEGYEESPLISFSDRNFYWTWAAWILDPWLVVY